MSSPYKSQMGLWPPAAYKHTKNIKLEATHTIDRGACGPIGIKIRTCGPYKRH